MLAPSSEKDSEENNNNIPESTKNNSTEENTNNNDNINSDNINNKYSNNNNNSNNNEKNNLETKIENANSEDDYEVLSEDHPEYDLSFKVVVIGDSGVGKSCLSVKATKNIFDNEYSSTIGFEFFKYNLKIKDTVIRLQIWDTCGQEIYRSLVANFYRNASLAIIVYSINE